MAAGSATRNTMNEIVLKNLQDILQEAAKDELTRFYRREALTPFLDKLAIDASNQKKPFSVALVDIDHFKKFNDKYGHLFGDEVLKYIASTLRLTIENAGHIFRYGGDEFVIVFPCKDIEPALQLMRKCNYCVANRPFSYRGRLIVITISCGVASFPSCGETTERLLKKADDALYFSKRYGRNATTVARNLAFRRLSRFVFLTGGIIIVVLGAFLVNRYIFSDQIKYLLTRLKAVKLVSEEPKDLDTITLKSGRVVKGYIVEERKGKVEVSLELLKGKGTILIDTSEIGNIAYGAAQPQKKEEKASH